ncbi:MAG: restriction endonuclease subunit S [Ruminococcus sp.]|uniref:restriction endonuclease subunit S n=1 Tax=Ruminococcus sp. TaxID=41978 RepID=UPI0025F00EE0|nr:restriction endonuclease subunit S [Ruminococcus sp.]MCR5599518.1 restriction endonuclease subunit S [Ruminococcus sp.]
MAKLSEICTINMGQSPESTTYNENGEGLPFFQGKADFGKIHPNVRVWCNAPKKIAHKNDILISVRAPIGALNVADSDCCIGRGLASLSVNNSVSVAEYIWYALESKVDYLISMGTGSTFKAIGKNILFDLDIPLPPLEIQYQIADNLDKVTQTINLCNAILEKLDLLVKSRFVEMFYNTDDKRTIADICSIITDGTHQPPKFTQDGIPFLFVSNIVTNEITYNAEKFISEETYDELYKRTPIEIGDIVLSTVGSYGHPAVVKTNKKFLFQRHIAYLKPISSVVNSIYLHSAILSNDAQRQIEERVKGIAQKTLNLSEIRKITVPIPPLALQEQFAAFVEQTDKSKLAVKQVLEKAETLKKALMQEYFG